jgi:hypothetical protein
MVVCLRDRKKNLAFIPERVVMFYCTHRTKLLWEQINWVSIEYFNHDHQHMGINNSGMTVKALDMFLIAFAYSCEQTH